MDEYTKTMEEASELEDEQFFATCRSCGKDIMLRPYGKHWKWAVITADEKGFTEDWHCGEDPGFPVKGHSPASSTTVNP